MKMRDQAGNTVETITVSLAAGGWADGEWFVAHYPNGRSIPSNGNPRGWYRTMKELRDAGIDIASLVEIRNVDVTVSFRNVPEWLTDTALEEFVISKVDAYGDRIVDFRNPLSGMFAEMTVAVK